jgi:hypothetical protein
MLLSYLWQPDIRSSLAKIKDQHFLKGFVFLFVFSKFQAPLQILITCFCHSQSNGKTVKDPVKIGKLISFSRENRLGVGRFNSVLNGTFENTKSVAIKRLFNYHFNIFIY